MGIGSNIVESELVIITNIIDNENNTKQNKLIDLLTFI